MKPTKEILSEKFVYDGKDLIFSKDSGKGGRFARGSKAGSLSKGIRMVCVNGKYYQAHQLIWTMAYGEWPQRAIRHINGILDDNRLENLSMDSMARGKKDEVVNVDRLKEVFTYDPETGIFRWKISPRNRTLPGDLAGHVNDSGYMVVTIDKQLLRMHRAAWAIYYGEMPSKHIDHINGIRSDNRICNLRLATKSENCQNTARRKDNKTGAKGVHYRKDTGKYSATISLNGKTMNLGCFDDFESAVKARHDAEIKYHPYRSIGR